tara:strand:- start:260 stop:490 length:231 start_codon:yes stop_codon:yes gene_type:complete
MHLNSYNAPAVNVVSNFKNLESCEVKFDNTLNRFVNADITGVIKYDNDGNKYLEIEDSNKRIKSYWFCKEIIFYKK